MKLPLAPMHASTALTILAASALGLTACEFDKADTEGAVDRAMAAYGECMLSAGYRSPDEREVLPVSKATVLTVSFRPPLHKKAPIILEVDVESGSIEPRDIGDARRLARTGCA